MKTRLISIALSMLALCSCNVFDSEVIIVDRGFEVRSEVAWNSDYLCYTMRLYLESGEAGRYAFTYSIDSDPMVHLMNTGGAAVNSGSEITLDPASASVMLLPPMVSSRRHVITMSFARNGVTRSYELELPDTNQNEIGVRVDASASVSSTRVTLTSLMGSSVTVYHVSFYLDGNLLEGITYMGSTFGGEMDIEFSRTGSFVFELPYVIPGQHTLRVDVRTDKGTESSSVVFSEPERKRTELLFSYNPYTGNLMVMSPYNPMKTSFNITTDITVKGKVTYRHELFFGIADPATEYFTLTSEASVALTPGLTAQPTDSGTLKRLMDSIHSNARTDAANALGNSNRRTLYADIYEIELKYTVSSAGTFAGKTTVSILPAKNTDFNIEYTYSGPTWTRVQGSVQNIHPLFTVNGLNPSDIYQL